MKTNYCTIFDRNYLFQGFALFLSLRRTTEDFMLYVLCMDDETLEVMGQLADAQFLTPISEHDLRARFPELETHAQRTNRDQYCWSCQPFAIQFLLERFALPSLTYLEADSLFFSSPQPLLDEVGWRSVSIVPHRYSRGLDQTAKSGRFCVQFNLFRNDDPAREALDSWKMACLEYRRELSMCLPGQKDLDTWPERFAPYIAVIENRGAGVAPWNVQQYRIQNEGGVPYVNEQPTIFYHFHQFAYLEGARFDFGGYRLSRSAIDAYYRPYVKHLGEVEKLVCSRFPEFRYRNLQAKTSGWRGRIRVLRRRVRGRYNVFHAGQL
jgi:hypothetical protein